MKAFKFLALATSFCVFGLYAEDAVDQAETEVSAVDSIPESGLVAAATTTSSSPKRSTDADQKMKQEKSNKNEGASGSAASSKPMNQAGTQRMEQGRGVGPAVPASPKY